MVPPKFVEAYGKLEVQSVDAAALKDPATAKVEAWLKEKDHPAASAATIAKMFKDAGIPDDAWLEQLEATNAAGELPQLLAALAWQ